MRGTHQASSLRSLDPSIPRTFSNHRALRLGRLRLVFSLTSFSIARQGDCRYHSRRYFGVHGTHLRLKSPHACRTYRPALLLDAEVETVEDDLEENRPDLSQTTDLRSRFAQDFRVSQRHRYMAYLSFSSPRRLCKYQYHGVSISPRAEEDHPWPRPLPLCPRFHLKEKDKAPFEHHAKLQAPPTFTAAPASSRTRPPSARSRARYAQEMSNIRWISLQSRRLVPSQTTRWLIPHLLFRGTLSVLLEITRLVLSQSICLDVAHLDAVTGHFASGKERQMCGARSRPRSNVSSSARPSATSSPPALPRASWCVTRP
ncbi:hypothetical protein BD626DRAFT_171505 [Schizophyllum amplum]|uniref:Uncharacterized protein n=1 Tax=Schizophyllum amplum TaxID=97359 RepID=A0A550CR46_9AGAR|nr:hypothetical protein BD626DRAFT_171505 [Auriculariopsis ampla]